MAGPNTSDEQRIARDRRISAARARKAQGAPFFPFGMCSPEDTGVVHGPVAPVPATPAQREILTAYGQWVDGMNFCRATDLVVAIYRERARRGL